jgi:sulfite reductase (NADPH) hemoprotein beta-component
LSYGYAHFTTRQNVQFNWIPLEKSADVMDLLASVDMHGIQTSGNCIRNITSDERAGVAVDETVDPRPYAEIMRQWSTLHPEFAFLPRKFKIAITGASEDRAATAWHDVGLHVLRNAEGEVGFRGDGGRWHGPHADHRQRDSRVLALAPNPQLPWKPWFASTTAWAVATTYTKRVSKFWSRPRASLTSIEVEAEYQRILEQDGAPHTITQAELDRVGACFVPPALLGRSHPSAEAVHALLAKTADEDNNFARWLKQNVAPHQQSTFACGHLVIQAFGPSPRRRYRRSTGRFGGVGRQILRW